MSILKKNIAANFAGSLWRVLMELIFIPLYIKFMGIESWGLVGFFTTLLIMCGLLDMGLSSTINREMARLSALPGKEREMRNLVRTLEVIYWGIAVFVGIIALSLSPFLAHHWIKAGELSPKTIEQAFFIMGFVLAFQMPMGFYSGGLMGLQRHVLLNLINAGMSTLRGAGAVLILWLVSPTIQAFFLWQIFISLFHTFLLAVFLWRKLPLNKNRPVVQMSLIKGIWRFTAGMSGITVLAVILTQLDKIILSKMLSLEMFGYYTLASMVAMSLKIFYVPIFFSIYPRFVQLVSMDDQEKLIKLYHDGCQFMSVLILPVVVVVALFSYEILFLWTQSLTTTTKSYFLLSILICGMAINGLMGLPYGLQLAHGWTKLSLMKNVVAVILFVPFIIFMTKHYGAPGAASVWLVLNIGLILFEIPIMHLRLLRQEKWRWYWQDVCLPLAVCVLAAGIGRMLISGQMSQLVMLLSLITVFILTFAIAIVTTPVTRILLRERLLKIKMAYENK